MIVGTILPSSDKLKENTNVNPTQILLKSNPQRTHFPTKQTQIDMK